MADVSLDDYMQKKNFSVQIRNVGAKNRTGRGGSFMKGRVKFIKTTKQGKFQSPAQGKRSGPFRSPKVNIQTQKKGQISLVTKKNKIISLQTNKNKGLQDKSNIKNFSVSVPGKNVLVSGFNKKAFDARDKIASKRPKDAREKLVAKNKIIDARSKITKQNNNEEAKVVITGLGKTLKSIQSGGGQSNMGITRTLKQNTGVQLSGNSMTITRNVSNTRPQSEFEDSSNGNFKITRNIQSSPQAGVKLSNNSMTITRSINNTQNVSRIARGPTFTLKTTPVQQIEDDDDDYEEEETGGFSYSRLATQPHVVEKTLTVKYPQISNPQPIPVITSKPPIKPAAVAIKRKAPSVAPVSGPLKFAGGPLKFARPTMVADTVGVVKKPKIERLDSVEENPTQSFKVSITNLHSVVTQDDIIELFGAVGPMRKARLIREGLGEVVYTTRDDAMKAIQKYHNRELDGIPMQVKLVVPKPVSVPKPVQIPVTPSTQDDAPTGEPLKLFKSSSKTTIESDLDAGTLHKALFKIGAQQSKNVTFTVKI